MKTITRTIFPETRIVDSAKGIVDYIASDESIDSYREVIRAKGWKFTRFRKNAPFVDSHDYSTIRNQVGKVTDFYVEDGRRLVNRVQWAIDVEENELAQIGWKMTEAGYLKAVSVGFLPLKLVSKWDADPAPFAAQLKELEIDEADGVRVVYLKQEQIELSSCIIGANPNALAKAFKDGVLDDAGLETLSLEYAKRETDSAADIPDAVAESLRRAQRDEFLRNFETKIKTI